MTVVVAAATGIDAAVAELARGGTVVVACDETRTLVTAAATATTDTVGTLATHGRGLIRCAVEADRPARLGIPPMLPGETRQFVGVDHVAGMATAARVLADPAAPAGDLHMPGTLFPVACHPMGVLGRADPAEATLDLVRAAGLPPAALVCDATPEPAPRWPLVTVGEVVTHRRRCESVLQRVAEADLPLPEGRFRIVGYRNLVDGSEHIALVHGVVAGADPLVRRHAPCSAGDLFGSLSCACRRLLRDSLRDVVAAGAGVVLYDEDAAAADDMLRDLGCVL